LDKSHGDDVQTHGTTPDLSLYMNVLQVWIQMAGPNSLNFGQGLMFMVSVAS